jgi:hypothetical protein
MFEFVVTEASLREVEARNRPDFSQWVYDVLDTWLMQSKGEESPAAGTLLDHPRFGMIRAKDRRLLQDALAPAGQGYVQRRSPPGGMCAVRDSNPEPADSRSYAPVAFRRCSTLPVTSADAERLFRLVLSAARRGVCFRVGKVWNGSCVAVVSNECLRGGHLECRRERRGRAFLLRSVLDHEDGSAVVLTVRALHPELPWSCACVEA